MEIQSLTRKFSIGLPWSNEVLIKVIYSSINYKDMMVAGNLGLIRKYPHIPGIDVSPIVHKSNSRKFKRRGKSCNSCKALWHKYEWWFSRIYKVPELG